MGGGSFSVDLNQHAALNKKAATFIKGGFVGDLDSFLEL